MQTGLGTSGGPVVQVDDDGSIMVIGVHCYGDEMVNRATLLGYHGNEPDVFCEALDAMENEVDGRHLQMDESCLQLDNVILIDGILEGKRIRILNR